MEAARRSGSGSREMEDGGCDSFQWLRRRRKLTTPTLTGEGEEEKAAYRRLRKEGFHFYPFTSAFPVLKYSLVQQNENDSFRLTLFQKNSAKKPRKVI